MLSIKPSRLPIAQSDSMTFEATPQPKNKAYQM